MKKPLSLILSTLLVCGSAAAVAGPKSLVDGESGVKDGREYDSKLVNCSGKSEPVTIFKFKDEKKWCLDDSSYCTSSKMKAAKKACKAR